MAQPCRSLSWCVVANPPRSSSSGSSTGWLPLRAPPRSPSLHVSYLLTLLLAPRLTPAEAESIHSGGSCSSRRRARGGGGSGGGVADSRAAGARTGPGPYAQKRVSRLPRSPTTASKCRSCNFSSYDAAWLACTGILSSMRLSSYEYMSRRRRWPPSQSHTSIPGGEFPTSQSSHRGPNVTS